MLVPLPSAGVITLRPARKADASACLEVFRAAVRRGAGDHYSLSQRAAWAPAVIDGKAWETARLWQPTWVADVRGAVVGFCDLRPDGEINMLFVHPDHSRHGIGGSLLDEVERAAREKNMPRLHALASLVALPVFRRRGFEVVREQLVERRGEHLPQVVVEKLLEPVS